MGHFKAICTKFESYQIFEAYKIASNNIFSNEVAFVACFQREMLKSSLELFFARIIKSNHGQGNRRSFTNLFQERLEHGFILYKLGNQHPEVILYPDVSRKSAGYFLFIADQDFQSYVIFGWCPRFIGAPLMTDDFVYSSLTEYDLDHYYKFDPD